MISQNKAPERLNEEEARTIEWFRQNIPCQQTCPAQTDVSNFIGLVAEGRFDEAYQLNRRDNVFPGILGRICAKPCEENCRRGLLDDSMPICGLKRSTADFRTSSLLPQRPPVTRSQKVAIVGAGPAGLTCARNLREKGYRTTVYDMLPEPGGMLVGGIPAWRLPRDIVREEVDRYMDALGVEIQLNTRIGKDISLDSLLNQYEAVFLAAGCQQPARLTIPGENLKGFEYGLDWLEKVNFNRVNESLAGKRVVVLGAGFSALDCARSALRLGATEVKICYRRTAQEAPVDKSELSEGELEGLQFLYLVSPVEVIGNADGQVAGLRLVRNQLGKSDQSGRLTPQPVPGSEFVLPCDLVLSATGQNADNSWLPRNRKLDFNSDGRLKVDARTWMTGVKGLFAGGDFTGGARNVISAIADGHKAAASIHRFLSREKAEPNGEVMISHHWERSLDYEDLTHHPLPMLPVEKRFGKDPNRSLCLEVATGYSRDLAMKEASRCLQCQFNIDIAADLCILCGACTDVCPDSAIEMVPLDPNMVPENHSYSGLEGSMTITIDENKCHRCGRCLDRCPTAAISITHFRYTSPDEHQFTGDRGLAAGLPR